MNKGILSQLYDHQTAVRAAMAKTQAMLASGTADPQALAAARWALTRLLTGYQMFKHQRIFDPIGRSGGPGAGTAVQMKIECIAMGETFRSYLARWSKAGIDGRETSYHRDARDMMAMLQRHIVRERRGIEALLAPETRAA